MARRTTQPQFGPVELDGENPLTAAIASVLCPSVGLIDLVTGELWKYDYATAQPNYLSGDTVGIDSTANYGILRLQTDANLLSGPGLSHFAVMDYTAKTGSYAGLFGIASRDGAVSNLMLQDCGNAAWGVYPTSNYWDSGAAFGAKVVGVAGDSSSSSAYDNGVVNFSNGPAVAASSQQTVVIFGERVQITGYATKGRCYLSVVWRRRLTDAEAASFAANPWQIFKKRWARILKASAGGAVSLLVSRCTHAHAADGIALSSQSALAVADASHAHAADNVTLSAASSANLSIAEASHAHAADSLALSWRALLSISDAAHGHAADQVSLTTAAFLAIAEAVHAHVADSLVLDTSNATQLTTQKARHAQAADSPGLSLSTWLAVVNAWHAHLADSISLTSSQSLTIAEALHAHFSDVVGLSLPSDIVFTRAPSGSGPSIIRRGSERTAQIQRGARPGNTGGTRH
jgi:hypothetical protein